MIIICFDPTQRQSLSEDEQAAATEYGEHSLRTFLAIEPEYQRLGLDAKTLREEYAQQPYGGHYSEPGEDAIQEEKDGYAEYTAYNEAQDLINTCDTLNNYVTYWGRNILPEYIVGRQYITPPKEQGFGPAGWHYDGGQRHWPEAMDFLAQMESDSRTSDFGEEIRRNLILSVDTALQEIDVSDVASPPVFASQRDDLQNIRNMLSGQKFDEKRYKEYTKAPNYGL